MCVQAFRNIPWNHLLIRFTLLSLTLSAPIPQNGQTHSNNSSANWRRIVWVCVFFFYQGFLHRYWRFTGQQGKGGDHLLFHSTTSTRSRTLRIYLQLCMWDDYHVFLITTLVFTRLLLDEIYHLIELTFEWLIDDAIFVCLLDDLILGFCCSDLTLETGGFELASAITPVL